MVWNQLVLMRLLKEVMWLATKPILEVSAKAIREIGRIDQVIWLAVQKTGTPYFFTGGYKTSVEKG